MGTMRQGVLVIAVVASAGCSLLLDTSGYEEPVEASPDASHPDGVPATTTDATASGVDASANGDPDGGAGDGAAPPNPACPSDDPTLRLCIRFEGSVVDESGLAIPIAAAENLTYGAGKHGQAGRFTRLPQTNVTIANDARLAGARTIEAWIKPVIVARQTIIDLHDDLAMIVDADNTVRCRQPELTATVTVQENVWSHVACTLDGTTLRAYVDGVPAGTLASTNLVDNVQPTGIGQNSPTFSDLFDGFIDDVRVWSTTRTPEQIAASAKP